MKLAAFYRRDSFIYIVAILSSLFFSAWINSHEVVINPDGICYVVNADTYKQCGLKAAMSLCSKWPFYSLLIYALAKITTFSFTPSAYLLDALFSAMSVGVFIALVKELGGNRRTLWLAAFVILFFHEMNSVRQYIIRDHGYWVFYLASIWFLLRYFRLSHLRYVLGWYVSLAIAVMFRIEGVTFLLLLPLFALAQSTTWRHRLISFLLMYLPVLAIGSGMAIWLLLHPQQSMEVFGRFVEIPWQVHHGFSMMMDRFLATKQGLINLLPKESYGTIDLAFIALIVGWYVLSIIDNLSCIYTGLVVYAWLAQAASFTRQALTVLYGYLLVNFLVTALFFSENLFLAKRYLIAFSLVFMLWVPFALNKIRSKSIFLVLLLVIFLSTAGTIFTVKDRKAFIREAGEWLAANVPMTKSLYVDDQQLMYYSQHFNMDIYKLVDRYQNNDVLSHGGWKQFDYVALVIGDGQTAHDKKIKAVINEFTFPPFREFVNAKGDKVVIYKIKR